MEIVKVKIEDLKPSEYNPREMSKKEAKDLRESIKRFGLVEPIVVNSAPERKNIIIGGHMRYWLAKEMKHKEMPVVYVDLPDINKERELNLRLNKNIGHWDYGMLANFDEEILTGVGFGKGELDQIFDLEVQEDEFDTEAEAEKIREPGSKLGEVYQLGTHRLMCGDATKKENIEQLMGGGLADMVFTDPPFNIGIRYHSKTYKGRKVFSDKKRDQDYYNFLSDLISNAYLVSNKNSAFYFWSDETYISFIQNIYRSLKIRSKRVLIWVKERYNPTPQVGYNKIYEACVLGYKGKPFIGIRGKKWSEILNKDINWDDYFNIWKIDRDFTETYEHPTQKPLEMIYKPIRVNSAPGMIVLDLCGGSGSTLIACEQLNRRCYMMELDPKYCDVIRKRYENFVNKKED